MYDGRPKVIFWGTDQWFCAVTAELSSPLMPAVHPMAVRSFLTYFYWMLVLSNWVPGSSFSRGSDGNGLQSKCFRLWSSAVGLKKAEKYIVLKWLLILWTFCWYFWTKHYFGITSISKLRPFCTQWMCSSFSWNVQLFGLLWSKNT